MNGQTVSQQEGMETNHFRGQVGKAVAWALFAFVTSLGGSVLHGEASQSGDFLRDGVLFWSFIITSLTIEPLIATGLIALLSIVLTRAGCGRFMAPLLTACVLCGLTGVFDRAAAIALFVPLLIYAESFFEANLGRDDYARGFVAAWLTQLAFNVFVVIVLIATRVLT